MLKGCTKVTWTYQNEEWGENLNSLQPSSQTQSWMQREPWEKTLTAITTSSPPRPLTPQSTMGPNLFYQTCSFSFSRVVLGIKPRVATTSQKLGISQSLNLPLPTHTVGYTLYYIPLLNVEYILQYISLSPQIRCTLY